MSAKQLHDLIRAMCPIVQVVSIEEARIEDAVLSVIHSDPELSSSGYSVYRWALTEGLVRFNPDGTVASKITELAAPEEVLDHIRAHRGDPGCYILRDLRHFMTEDNPMVLRLLRDVYEAIAQRGEDDAPKTVVILGADQCLPRDLEDAVDTIEWELPDETDIQDTILGIMEALDPEEAERLQTTEEGRNDFQRIVTAAKGMTLNRVESMMSQSFVQNGKVVLDDVIREKKKAVRAGGVLEFIEVNTSMDDVGGLRSLKEWLEDRGDAYSSEARAYGLPMPRGVVLVGIPGTGKSLVSKTIGSYWGMPVVRMDIGSIFGSLVGQSEGNLRKALKQAEAVAPCVLQVDEIEKGFGGAGNALDGGTSTRVLGHFLTWMQEKEAPIFVVATANDVTSLPPEMLRKGRFDEIFFTDLPSVEEVGIILKIHVRRNVVHKGDIDYDLVVPACANFSGAELEQLVKDAMFIAFPAPLATDHLIQAAKATVPLHQTMGDKIEKLRKWAKSRARFAGEAPEDAVVQPSGTGVRRRSSRRTRTKGT